MSEILLKNLIASLLASWLLVMLLWGLIRLYVSVTDSSRPKPKPKPNQSHTGSPPTGGGTTSHSGINKTGISETGSLKLNDQTVMADNE